VRLTLNWLLRRFSLTASVRFVRDRREVPLIDITNSKITARAAAPIWRDDDRTRMLSSLPCSEEASEALPRHVGFPSKGLDHLDDGRKGRLQVVQLQDQIEDVRVPRVWKLARVSAQC
jgi:hypothetical protein